ncbi:MAG: hypothetical protein NVSMB25_21770 [Thermoleophilaceae bacterium]
MDHSIRAGTQRSRATGRNTSATRRQAPVRGPIRWQRVGRLALLGTLAVIVLLYIPPLMHWVEQHRAQARGQAELRALQGEHDRLASRLRELSTPAGLDRAARSIGMVRVGERPYVIEGPPPR